MLRPTTNGVLRSYRYNLRNSAITMNHARDTVLTQRVFNSFADDPATAARCFQLRRSYMRVNSQHAVGDSICKKYDVAWHTMESVIQDVSNRKLDSALAELIHGGNGPTASGRTALGDSMDKLAEGIVQTMNAKYGDNFVFSGADGMNIPFTWDDKDGLCYRGIPVDSAVPEVEMNGNVPKEYNAAGTGAPAPGDPVSYKGKDGTMITKDEYEKQKKNAETLEYMAKDEKKFADLGLGLQEDENGDLIQDSAFNMAIQGIDFLGYGKDADGDPKNVVSILKEISGILKNCDDDSGTFKPGDKEKLDRLSVKLKDASAHLTRKHTELDTRKKFLDSNQALLEGNAFTLETQWSSREDVDMADAISAFVWAKYCYDSSLKVGNSILSQSLMDYLNT